MTEEEYLSLYPWHSPTIESNSNRFDCVEGVTKITEDLFQQLKKHRRFIIS